MFRSRRRVPSEGALRVLRQLAYISSGTACGAAAVIAEERRRQTTLVSKIADNSRRLKQHPRYQHAHAAQRRATDDVSHSNATSITPDQDDTANRSPDEQMVPQADAFRNNLLPSEVERGYVKLDLRRPISHDQAKDNQRPQRTKPLPQSLCQSHPPMQAFDRPSFLAALETHGSTKALTQLDSHCSMLLANNEPGAAFRFFLNNVDSLKSAGTRPVELMFVATRLFHSLLGFESYQTCRRLLAWMHGQGWLVTDFVDCINSFALAGVEKPRPNVLTWLYETYGDDITFPHATYPALCAAYSIRDPGVCALLFARHILKTDRPSVLPLCEPAWPAIVERMWHKTHNYKLVNSLFQNMCRLTESPPLELYNAMIHVCIKSGRVGQAHQHLRTIQQSQNLDPDIVTFGHFVLLTTSSSDWPAVDDLMAMLVRAGEAEAPLEKRTDMFIPVFKAYAKLHSPAKFWSFAFKAIDDYGVLPDQRILDTAVRALVRAGRIALIPAWVNKMKTYGHGVEITPEVALAMMRQFYFDNRPSHVILLWLCRSLINSIPEYWSEGVLTLLIEAVMYDIRSYRSGLAHRKPQAMLMLEKLRAVDPTSPALPKPLYWYQMAQHVDQARTDVQKSNLERNLSTDFDEFLSEDDVLSDDMPEMALSTAAPREMWTENKILVALSEGRYYDVMKQYESSLGQSGLPASTYSLEMAIQACAKLPDEAGPPDEYIEAANQAGMNTTAALVSLLSQQMLSSARGTPLHIDELCKTVLSFYDIMAKHGVSIRHHLATAAATTLLRSGKTNDAVHLLSTVYHSKWGRKIPFDLPAMTVLLQAYINVSHSSGIAWVIKEVLDQNYRIDYSFLTVIRKAKKHSEQRSHNGNAKGVNHIKLSRMLQYYSDVCKAKQRTQIKHASHLGNRLVRIMIKLGRPGQEFQTPQMLREPVDPAIWGRGLYDAEGRRTVWRVIGSASGHEVRRLRKRDRSMRRRMRERRNSNVSKE